MPQNCIEWLQKVNYAFEIIWEIEEPNYVHFKSIDCFAPLSFSFERQGSQRSVHHNSINTVHKGSIRVKGEQAMTLSFRT